MRMLQVRVRSHYVSPHPLNIHSNKFVATISRLAITLILSLLIVSVVGHQFIIFLVVRLVGNWLVSAEHCFLVMVLLRSLAPMVVLNLSLKSSTTFWKLGVSPIGNHQSIILSLMVGQRTESNHQRG